MPLCHCIVIQRWSVALASISSCKRWGNKARRFIYRSHLIAGNCNVYSGTAKDSASHAQQWCTYPAHSLTKGLASCCIRTFGPAISIKWVHMELTRHKATATHCLHHCLSYHCSPITMVFKRFTFNDWYEFSLSSTKNQKMRYPSFVFVTVVLAFGKHIIYSIYIMTLVYTPRVNLYGCAPYISKCCTECQRPAV